MNVCVCVCLCVCVCVCVCVCMHVCVCVLHKSIFVNNARGQGLHILIKIKFAVCINFACIL